MQKYIRFIVDIWFYFEFLVIVASQTLCLLLLWGFTETRFSSPAPLQVTQDNDPFGHFCSLMATTHHLLAEKLFSPKFIKNVNNHPSSIQVGVGVWSRAGEWSKQSLEIIHELSKCTKTSQRITNMQYSYILKEGANS